MSCCCFFSLQVVCRCLFSNATDLQQCGAMIHKLNGCCWKRAARVATASVVSVAAISFTAQRPSHTYPLPMLLYLNFISFILFLFYYYFFCSANRNSLSSSALYNSRCVCISLRLISIQSLNFRIRRQFL